MATASQLEAMRRIRDGERLSWYAAQLNSLVIAGLATYDGPALTPVGANVLAEATRAS